MAAPRMAASVSMRDRWECPYGAPSREVHSDESFGAEPSAQGTTRVRRLRARWSFLLRSGRFPGRSASEENREPSTRSLRCCDPGDAAAGRPFDEASFPVMLNCVRRQVGSRPVSGSRSCLLPQLSEPWGSPTNAASLHRARKAQG